MTKELLNIATGVIPKTTIYKNVKFGAKVSVIKDVAEVSKVVGYPAQTVSVSKNKSSGNNY